MWIGSPLAANLPVVHVEGDRVFADSRDVAAAFGKQHQHVIRDVEVLLAKDPSLRASSFGRSSYLSAQNKQMPCHWMNREGFTLLVMGFNGAEALRWKRLYIQAFDRMEAELRAGSVIPQDPELLLSRALLVAHAKIEQVEQRAIAAETKLVEQQPKVAAFDRIASTEGTRSLRTVSPSVARGSRAEALRDLRDGSTRAAHAALDGAPVLASTQQRGNGRIAVNVLWPATILALRLRLRLPLRLPAAAIFVVLASDGGEHVQHHAVDGGKHAIGELVPRGKLPRRREVERHNTDFFRVQVRPELLPIALRQAREAINLFDQEHVAGLAVADEAEQFRARELRAAFVLDIGGGDGEPVFGGERLNLSPRTGGVLLIRRGAKVGPGEHSGNLIGSFWMVSLYRFSLDRQVDIFEPAFGRFRRSTLKANQLRATRRGY